MTMDAVATASTSTAENHRARRSAHSKNGISIGQAVATLGDLVAEGALGRGNGPVPTDRQPRRGRRHQPLRRAPIIASDVASAQNRILGGVRIALVTVNALALYDVLSGPKVQLAGLLTVGPCLAATSGTRRAVVAIGGYAVLMILLLSWPDRIWWTRTQLLDLLAVAAVTAVSTVIAQQRISQERQILSALGDVKRGIADRIAAEDELRLVGSQRHALLTRLVIGQEHERARIAADVHDDSVQALAAVDLRLGLLQRKLKGGPPEWGATIEQLQVSVSGAADRLRALLFDLEPPAADVSLNGNLLDIAAYIFEDGGTAWSLQGDPLAELPYSERVKAVRIAKEALMNVREHAHASAVVITVQSINGGVEIAVTDDGIGVDPTETSAHGHRGLTTMRDRAEIAGGWWRLERATGQGTTVRFWIPDVPTTDAHPVGVDL